MSLNEDEIRIRQKALGFQASRRLDRIFHSETLSTRRNSKERRDISEAFFKRDTFNSRKPGTGRVVPPLRCASSLRAASDDGTEQPRH
ncbi:hypothetical protein L596_009211 [Steinernema carpocapsae]|uniref:Uncharacterized protein n=1 Tax=Steinernema carpocapsae TaxID=34508 RepID=A0A4U5PF41_STECR|nr:hypothetical protein L596_009211 [Steinernema carpocapsae]